MKFHRHRCLAHENDAGRNNKSEHSNRIGAHHLSHTACVSIENGFSWMCVTESDFCESVCSLMLTQFQHIILCCYVSVIRMSNLCKNIKPPIFRRKRKIFLDRWKSESPDRMWLICMINTSCSRNRMFDYDVVFTYFKTECLVEWSSTKWEKWHWRLLFLNNKNSQHKQMSAENKFHPNSSS